MTLIVSEISSYGIVMVGDSAITRKKNGSAAYHDGCVKVQFSEKARIGFSIWGRANVGNRRMDEWLSEFIEKRIGDNEPIESVGQRLADELNAELKAEQQCFQRGIHIAGYVDNLPVLWHVHSGHLDEAPHEIKLYRDYPPTNMEVWEREEAFGSGGFWQLRNGRFKHFSVLFEHVQSYTETLREILGTTFPPPDIKGRLEFYKMLIKFVAGVLQVSDQDRSVNDQLSWVAFDRYGSTLRETVKYCASADDQLSELDC